MTRQQRLVVIISILASFVAFLDGSVVNVALPAIKSDLGGGLPFQQWIVNAYLLTLGSFILLAGSLSDLFGRKKILYAGLLGFGVTSVLCAIAPHGVFLIAARLLQGLSGALLVPSSLALIISTFEKSKQGKAIGIWTAWTGMAFLIGPLLGGFLVDTFSWRYIFAINVLPITATLWLMRSLNPDEKIRRNTPVDYGGAVLGSAGLAGVVYGLIEQTNRGLADPLILFSLVAGMLLLALFIWHEKRTSQPMLPLELFKVRNFTAGNIATTSIYAGLSVATFLLVIFVQEVGGYSAIQAGLSLLPITLIMFALSPRFGELASIYGPRLFMTIGPFIASVGFLLLLRVDEHVTYLSQILPGITLFGLGLSITVAPLTTAVLSDIKQSHAGVGSAVNNAISRIAGLIATAAVGLLVSQQLSVAGFKRGMVAIAVLLAIGGVVSAIGIVNPSKKQLNPQRQRLGRG